jgi:hypothetical protein
VRAAFEDGTEVLIAILFCLLFFLLLQLLLSFTFPSGMGLRELIGRASRTDTNANGGTVATSSVMGVLTVLKSDVRAKKNSEIEWKAANSGAVLRGGDAVQTSARGDAKIMFEATEVRLGRNSLIVIKQPGTTRAGRRRRSMTVDRGDVLAKMPAQAARDAEFEIEAGGARIRVRPDPSMSVKSQVRVVTGPGQKPAFLVYGGTADVEAYGRMVRLHANQFTTIDENGPIDPKPLLAPPRLVAPAAGSRIGLEQGGKGVDFRWSTVEKADAYRVLVARDREFEDVKIDERPRRASHRSGALEPGKYWWMVSSMVAGVEGVPSPVGTFAVRRSLQGPPLRVTMPPAVVRGDHHLLEGRTEPGATVVAGGQRVKAGADGRFAVDVTLEPGMNAIIVEAIDRQGNSSYASTIVNAKIKGR